MIPRRIQHRADVSEGSIFLDHGGIPHSLGDYPSWCARSFSQSTTSSAVFFLSTLIAMAPLHSGPFAALGIDQPIPDGKRPDFALGCQVAECSTA